MKKIFITFFILITISNPLTVFWGACSIKDSAPEELVEYIVNVRKIVSNITTNATKTDSSLKKTHNQFLRGANSLSSWGDYETEFEFFVVKPITSEIPAPMKRDDRYLWNEIDGLNSYIWNIVRRWYYDSFIEKKNVCSWISKECNLEWTAWDIVMKLIENTSNIRHLLQLSVTWHPWDFNWNIILVDSNFKNVITNLYSEDQVMSCSSAEGWFFEQITEAVSNISINDKYAKDGIKKWKDAWALLVWTKVDEKRERDLLLRELWRQWVSWDQTEAILKNLDNYNGAKWYTLENNFITNSFKWIYNSINTQIDAFAESIKKNFWTDTTKKTTSIQELTQTTQEVNNSKTIEIKIEELYKSQIPLAQMQDLDTSKITTQIIKMHADLWLSINTLEKAVPVSQKVCRDQWSNISVKCEF